jgi:hypothetical protein
VEIDRSKQRSRSKEKKKFIPNIREVCPSKKKKGKQNESIYFPNVKLLKLSSSNAPQSTSALDAG